MRRAGSEEDRDIAAAETVQSANRSLDETVPSGDFGRVDLTKDTDPTVGDEPVIERGTTIGRYVVLDRLGSGTMGVVLSAIDPTLDRKVALKLVRADRSGSTVGRQRLLREAQAMARLSHPNVVTVFEVGTYRDRVFLAMEYVAGATLAAWLAQPGHPQREIVQTFLAAGHGLAAAHRGGIVHRDFKPANVLVAKDGRVRVADFGLATAPETRPTTPAPIEIEAAAASEIEMTSTGAILGTPAYMAPEQHRGQGADARADQFAFCVALYEALYGELPFEGTDYLVYAENVLAGRLRESRGPVPAWLRKVLVRGLALDPAARYPSMDGLLADLARDPAALRRKLAIGSGAIAVTALLAVFAVRGGSSTDDPCTSADQSIARAWNPATRQRLEQVFTASGIADANDVFARAAKLFDVRARELGAARRDACLATAVRHEQSADMLDRRMQCIDQLTGELDALVGVLLEHRDATSIHKSVEAATHLAPVQQCADRTALLAVVAPPASVELRVRAAALDKQIDHVHALLDTGNLQAAARLTPGLVAEADRLGYTPLRARAQYFDASAKLSLGHHEEAATELRALGELAAAAHDDRLLAKAWLLLYSTVGYQLARIDQARSLEPTVVAAVVRAGDPVDLRAGLENAKGNIDLAAAEYPHAAEHYANAVRLYAQALGPKDPKVAANYSNASNALEGAGRYKEAREALDHALAIQVEVLGPEHPDVALSHYHIGSLLDSMQQPKQALAEFEKAVAIDEKVYPKGAPLLAENYVSIGVVLDELGRAKEALDYQQRALEIFQHDAANNQRRIIVALEDLGVTYRELKRAPEAIRTFEQAIALAKQVYGQDNMAAANIMQNLALVYLNQGDRKRARATWQQVLAMREAKLGRDHPDVAKTLTMLADVVAEDGNPTEAVRDLDRAVDILEHVQGPKLPLLFEVVEFRGQTQLGRKHYAEAARDLTRARDAYLEQKQPPEAAKARLTLAAALWGQGAAMHAEAITEAKTGLAELEAQQPPDGDAIKTAKSWLAKHRK